ncbi:MAG TPA: tetratricopeptide repeat protein [Candidatus Saccharicenans sp.]|nr:tetratricopeptide repeat protein [Candidatus Saccharicenans sp.]HNT00582.1 tetratricopeptide repeat protein [Candidatus Saccharicenans sp.]
MKKLNWRLVLIVTILFFAGESLLLAQAGRGVGRLGGVILDENDQPIEGARVVMTFIQEAAGGLQMDTKTNKKGEWSFIGLGSGKWSLMASADGYAPYTQEVVVSQLEKNPRLTIKLKKVTTGTPIIEDESSLKLLDEGNEFFKEGKYDTALTLYQEFLEKNPAAYQVLLNIGDCYREKGEIDKAMETYQQVIEKARDDRAMGINMKAKALAAIGLVYLKQNNLEEATKYFKQSVDTAPQDEIVAFNVAEVCFNNQQLDEAQKYYELAASIKPDWPDPLLKLGYVFLNKNDIPKAIEYFEKFLKLEPQDSPRVGMVEQILQAIKK